MEGRYTRLGDELGKVSNLSYPTAIANYFSRFEKYIKYFENNFYLYIFKVTSSPCMSMYSIKGGSGIPEMKSYKDVL